MPRVAAALLSLVFTGLAFAQSTVTLQPSGDNWIIYSSGANTNKGGLTELDLRDTNTDSGLVRFNIFQSEGGPVPSGATITSATISIYKAFGADAVFKASLVLRPWTEMGATWNVTGSGASWTTPGAQGAGSDILATADGQGSAPDSAANNCADGIGHDICFLNIDVTAGVQAFSSGAMTNNG